MGVPSSTSPAETPQSSRPPESEEPTGREEGTAQTTKKGTEEDISEMINMTADAIEKSIMDSLKSYLETKKKRLIEEQMAELKKKYGEDEEKIAAELKKKLSEELGKDAKLMGDEIAAVISAMQKAADLKTSMAAAETKISEVQKAEATRGREIFDIIRRNCDNLLVSIQKGVPSYIVDLKKEINVHKAFQGAQLTLTKTDAGLTINFQNFLTEAHRREAIETIINNRDLLTQLIDNLRGKGLNVSEFYLGRTKIELPVTGAPRVEVTRPQAEGTEARERRGGEDRRGGGGGEGEPGQGGRR